MAPANLRLSNNRNLQSPYLQIPTKNNDFVDYFQSSDLKSDKYNYHENL